MDEIQVEQTRLHPCQTIVGPHLQDLVHLGGDHHECVADRGGGAGETGPASARDDREAVLGSDGDAGDDVLGRAGERDERASTLDHGGVAGIELQREWIAEDLRRSERLLERSACAFDVRHDSRVGLVR